MTRRLVNEEEVKLKYVLPVLRRLGFDTAADLRFEYAFPANVSGRRRTTFADIVVIRGGHAVLVIEVKAADIDIRDPKAIDQAVGYSRSNKTVIPYALITNGRDCLLVDTLIAEPIAVGRELFNTEVDFLLRSELLLKREALRLMGAVSPEGLISLATDQRRRALGSMSGDGAPSSLIVDKKYLAGLYAPRHRLEDAFDRFLLSQKHVFALVGDAGLGKTTFLCNLSSRLGTTRPVFFYHGAEISGTWEDLLLADIGTALSVGSLSEALPRIGALSAGTTGEVFVFIDALNECSGDREAVRSELNACARVIRDLPVRLVVSCRTLDWDFWTRNERRMTGDLGRAVYSESAATNSPAVSIARFDEGEFLQAWKLYESGFGLVGTLSSRMADLCREPFMMRLVAEVYRGGAPIPDFVEPLGLFERYWREKFPSQSGELEAGQFLNWMAQRILDTKEARVRTADIPSASLGTCLDLLDESVLIRRLASHLYFRFELFLEFVLANHLMATLPEEADDAQREDLVAGLTASTLVNMPGVVENILLTWKHSRPLLYACLRRLAALDDRWKAICCSVLRKLGERPGESADVIDLLATSTNHVVRAFLAESLSRTDSGADIARLATRDESWESRETAAIALGSMGRLDAGTQTMLAVLSDDFHWRVRRAAGYALKELWADGPRGNAWKRRVLRVVGEASWRQKYTLCSALVGTQLDVRSLAATVIGDLANDLNTQVRWGVANYVLRCGSPWGHPAICRLLNDEDPWVRARLANSLVAVSSSSVGRWEGPLQQLADDPAAVVRVKLARELPSLSDAALARRILNGYLDDQDEDVAFAARYSLSAMGEVDLADSAKAAESEIRIRILRERIARRDANPAAAISMPTYEYIARRSELRAHADSYMWLIDAMCSLIIDSMSAAGKEGSGIGRLLSLLCDDQDEAVRWALVAFLVRFGGEQLPTETRLSTLRRLAHDDHWWVRREVALAMGEGNDRLMDTVAIALLDEITERERATPQDCSDEVLYFSERSAQHMRSLVGGGAPVGNADSAIPFALTAVIARWGIVPPAI